MVITMSNYKNSGLVEHAKQMLELPTSYMWGTLARKITADMISWCRKTYPNQYTAQRAAYLTGQIGKRYGCDCIGLIKSYYFGGIGSPKYDAAKDVDTGTMFNRAVKKGTIGTLPEQPGLVLYMPGHVGVYIGDGMCIECTLGSYGDGVVKSKVAGRGWTHWFQCPYIDADNTDAAEDYPLTLNKGDKVKVKDGAKTYTGGKLAAYVYGSVYDVLEVAGNRVVIGIGKTVTAAVRKTDLVKQ